MLCLKLSSQESFETLRYARVSTKDQGVGIQEEARRASGCKKSFVETASGVSKDGPVLQEALEFVRAGEVLEKVLSIMQIDS